MALSARFLTSVKRSSSLAHTLASRAPATPRSIRLASASGIRSSSTRRYTPWIDTASGGAVALDCARASARNWSSRSATQARQKTANLVYKTDEQPIEPGCACHACANFSRAYLHHVKRCSEMLAPMASSIHSLLYDVNLMREVREALDAGVFAAFAKRFGEERRRGV